jgi:hypothetical protein
VETSAAYIALLFSVIALAIQLRDRLSSYLKLTVSIERRDPGTVVTTCVENSSPRPRRMTKIFLLLGPEEENPVESFNALMTANGQDRRACCAIDFEDCNLPTRFTDREHQRLLVPLDYYIEENPEVGDESLSCQTSILDSELGPGRSYGVRFYVFGHKRGPARIHRKVHAILALPGQPSTRTPSPMRQPCRGHKGCGAK